MKHLSIFLLIVLLAGCTGAPKQPAPPRITMDSALIEPIDSPTTASLRGLCVVSRDVIWASGASGTVIRSTDAGATWSIVGPEDAADIDFRDIHAFDENTAVILSAGQPAGVWRTTDAGTTWQQTFADDHQGAFYDAMDFWDDRRGIAMSDPVDGHMRLISTRDAGKTWTPLPEALLPPPLDGEAGFAASGTCIAVASGRLNSDRAEFALYALGAQSETNARVIASTDSGTTWTATTTPITSSDATGIFSVDILPNARAIAVGGNYQSPDDNASVSAISRDAGQTWTPSQIQPRGYRSCVSFIPGTTIAITTGPNGTDFSYNAGDHWQPLDDHGYNVLHVDPHAHVAWFAGSDGRLARMNINIAP